MKFFSIALLCATVLLSTAFTADKATKTVHDFTVKDINGDDVKLDLYKGKVLLIVNVASKCGLTPQYADLQEIYDEYSKDGLEILGFPANNFMGQEPGSNAQIKTFCSSKYGVTFPMFSKISVKGKNIHPLYEFLTKKANNGSVNAPVSWNFQKFLINTKGEVVTSFSPRQKVTKEEVRKMIKKELRKIK